MSSNSMDVAGGSKAHIQPRPWLALLIVVLAAFMDLMDICIVNIAIPSIQSDLNTNYSMIQWIVAGYSLAFAVFLITGGRLGDIFGRKRMFLIGVAGFTVFSALCGIANSDMVLVSSRVMQGAMAAIMVPQVLSIIQVSFNLQERAKAAAIFGAMAGLATVCGPILGGVLTHNNIFNLSWRPIFLINVPVGIFAFIAAAIIIKESKAQVKLGLDIIGVLMVSIALFLFLFPFVQGRELNWSVWGFILSFVSAIVLFIGFILYELRISKKGSPLLVLGLFKEKAFTIGLLVNFFVYAGVQAFFLVFTVYFQVGLGFSVMSAGLVSLPWSIGLMIASAVASQKVYSLGKKVLYFGTFLLTIGMACLLLGIAFFGTDIKVWQICIATFISGTGMGCVAPTLITIIISGVKNDDAGSASGIINTVTQLGNAIGIAVIGVVFFGIITSTAPKVVDSLMPAMKVELQNSGVTKSLSDEIAVYFKDEYIRGMDSSNSNSNDTEAGSEYLKNKETKRITEETTQKALKISFSDSAKKSLIGVVILFALAFIMVILFPKSLKINENQNDVML